MTINSKLILQFLERKGTWVESSELAEYFQVSSRTIRNYVRKASEQYGDCILSSYKGYKLSENFTHYELQKDYEEIENRSNYIIRKLLCCSSLDFYDLADEMYISDSTLELELRKCKDTLSQFHLYVKKNRKHLALEGNEREKRKLMSYLINKENVNEFIKLYNDVLTKVNDIDFIQLCQQLHRIFVEESVYANDYEINNIALHITVIITRIHAHESLQEVVEISKIKKTHDYRIALQIERLLGELYHVKMNEAEIYYLTLLISSNSTTLMDALINRENIEQFIDEEYIQLSKKIIRKLTDMFFLEGFDDSFFIKFTIHIKNLCSRLKNNISTSNPLSLKIKKEYPLIYDMAVYVAGELKAMNYGQIADDEIAFLAFHIGAYLENDNFKKDRVKCCFVYMNYHNMHQKCLEKLMYNFENDICINKVLPFEHINQVPMDTEMIFTMNTIDFDMQFSQIQIGLLLSDDDIKRIREALIHIKLNRKRKQISDNMRKFVGEKLFFKELYANSVEDMIEILCNNCQNLGLCDSFYEDEVLEREKISSTSFPNHVAVPHSLIKNTKQSFLSIVMNSKPMRWGEFDVNLIILIGFSKIDHDIFTGIFDSLIAALYEQENVDRLLKCSDYTTFMSEIEDILIL
ncbi:BglG family transcription antiterminator [Amedibacillus sp. YH-ame6]